MGTRSGNCKHDPRGELFEDPIKQPHMGILKHPVLAGTDVPQREPGIRTMWPHNQRQALPILAFSTWPAAPVDNGLRAAALRGQQRSMSRPIASLEPVLRNEHPVLIPLRRLNWPMSALNETQQWNFWEVRASYFESLNKLIFLYLNPSNHDPRQVPLTFRDTA